MADIRTHNLQSGVILATERMPSVASAAVSVRLPLGAAYDPEGAVGVSAILEEQLLRGSVARTSREQADAFDAIGAGRSTSNSTFHLSLGATTIGARLHDTLGLLMEMALSPRLDDAGFRASRELCLQSVRGLADDPAERAMITLRERHAGEPINRSHMGTEAGLSAATADIVREHFAARSGPAGTLIGVAGAIDHDEVAAAITALTEDWAAGASVAADIDAKASSAGERGYGHVEQQSNQTHIAVAFDAPPERDDEAVYERLATAVLSGGMSGRLFTEVREKRGLCYSVSASYATSRDYGRLTAYVGTTPDKAQESLDVLLGELTRLGEPGGAITQSEFDRAKTGLKSRLVMSGESTRGRASALSVDLFRLGRPRSLEEVAEAIDGATLDGLNAYLAGRDIGRMTVVSVGPAPLESGKHAALV